MKLKSIIMIVGLCLTIGCDDDWGECSTAYVEELTGTNKTVEMGGSCFRKSNSDCPGVFVSNCISGECFNDICQSGECSSDADCTHLNSKATCQVYKQDGQSFGYRCYVAHVPSGGGSCDDGCLDNCTVGAACLAICCR